MTDQKELLPHELIMQVRARLEVMRKCNGAMCTHCIDILCEDVLPMVDLAITRTQPAEDERVKEIREAWSGRRAPAGAIAKEHIEYLLSLLPVQPAHPIDLSLLPYEIAEELPKIGGKFGELAAMCRSHVAAFIEKLINARTGQPAASTPTDEVQQRMDAVVEAAVEWHQSGREGDNSWFDKGEALGVAIDRLLELRQPPQLHESDVDKWKRELTSAGWVAESAIAWRSPNGSLWRGPYRAWQELQRQQGASNV